MQQARALRAHWWSQVSRLVAVLAVIVLLVPPGTATAQVQTLTGNWVYRWADFRPAGSGPLMFQRTYNSADSRTSVLGPGWTHNFNVYLARPTNRGPEDRMFVGPMGRQELHTAVGDGEWQPSLLAQGKLTRQVIPEADNLVTYTLEQQDGTTYHFNEGGLAIQIKYRDGVEVGISHDREWRVSRVTAREPAKFSLHFTYDDAGRLASVSEASDAARAVEFGYDDLGRLTSATNRVGQPTHYTYHGESSKLHQVIDARGHAAITMEYDGEGRALRQSNARALVEGKAITFEYIKLGDGRTRVEMTEPPSSFAPTTLTRRVDTYDAEDRISERVTELGPGDEPLVQTYGPTRLAAWGIVKATGGKTPEPAAGGEPISSYMVPGYREPVPVTIGSPTLGGMVGPPRVDDLPRKQLAELRHLAVEQTHDRFGRVVGLALPPGIGLRATSWRVEYDGEDRIVALTQDGGSQSVTFRYDEVGNLVEIARADGTVRQFEYDDRDDMVKYTDEDGVIRQFEYEERNWTSKMIETPADGGPSRVVEYEHDGLGRLRVVRDFANPDAPVTTEFSYNLMEVTGIWQR